MNERIGFTGLLDGKYKVFFDGCIHYTELNGRNLAVDWEGIDFSRKTTY